MPFSTTDFSIKLPVGQACTQAPHETHSESKKFSETPGLIFDSNPLDSTDKAKVP